MYVACQQQLQTSNSIQHFEISNFDAAENPNGYNQQLQPGDMNKFSGKEVVWMDFWRYYLDECKKHIIVNGTDDVYFRSKDQLKERMKTIKRIVDAGTENKSVHIKNFFTTQS